VTLDNSAGFGESAGDVGLGECQRVGSRYSDAKTFAGTTRPLAGSFKFIAPPSLPERGCTGTGPVHQHRWRPNIPLPTHLSPRTRPPASLVFRKNMARPNLTFLPSLRRARGVPGTRQVLRRTRERAELLGGQFRRWFPDGLAIPRVVEVGQLARVGETDFPAGHDGRRAVCVVRCGADRGTKEEGRDVFVVRAVQSGVDS
jgi:hypothetical protein